jgi:hypothetical protein
MATLFLFECTEAREIFRAIIGQIIIIILRLAIHFK